MATPPPMKDQLARLPHEVRDMVIALFHPLHSRQDRHALAALTCVCKELCKLAAPRLYHTFALAWLYRMRMDRIHGAIPIEIVQHSGGYENLIARSRFAVPTSFLKHTRRLIASGLQPGFYDIDHICLGTYITGLEILQLVHTEDQHASDYCTFHSIDDIEPHGHCCPCSELDKLEPTTLIVDINFLEAIHTCSDIIGMRSGFSKKLEEVVIRPWANYEPSPIAEYRNWKITGLPSALRVITILFHPPVLRGHPSRKSTYLGYEVRDGTEYVVHDITQLLTSLRTELDDRAPLQINVVGLESLCIPVQSRITFHSLLSASFELDAPTSDNGDNVESVRPSYGFQTLKEYAHSLTGERKSIVPDLKWLDDSE